MQQEEDPEPLPPYPADNANGNPVPHPWGGRRVHEWLNKRDYRKAAAMLAKALDEHRALSRTAAGRSNTGAMAEASRVMEEARVRHAHALSRMRFVT